jgi:hypothetical protein
MGGWSLNSSDYSFLPDIPFTLNTRSSYAGQMMIARKFSQNLSLQMSPMLAYFNNPVQIYQIGASENLYTALGFSGKYKLTGRTSLTLQYIQNMNTKLKNNIGVGVDFEAGGHVFQVYFVTSQALNETYLLAGRNGTPIDGFRLGFNVNRIFVTGKK